MADSLSLRSFVGVGVNEASPDHSTVSRNRRAIDVEAHQEVFTWVLGVLAKEQLISGKSIGVDATTLEANAALRSIVRRDSKDHTMNFNAPGQGVRDRNADAGGFGQAGSGTPEERLQSGMGASARSGSADHQDEGWQHASGPQGRACGGHG